MMNEAPKKGNPTLSIDRAAFLLLRVKKAFKKKRQQRKEKQAAQQAAAVVAAQTKTTRKGPPPLLRSRTLPAIVVPGFSILQAQIDPNRLSTGDALAPTPSFIPRWSLQPKSSRASLVSDDSGLEFRRKSSGSTHSGPPMVGGSSGGGFYGGGSSSTSGGEPYLYVCDDLERHSDGTVVLRIPAPHIVAARAYRVSSASSSSSSGPTNYYQSQQSGSSGLGASTTASNTALYRLARLLNQTTKTGGGRESPTMMDDDSPRRLSWERRDHCGNKFPRSTSIDSMVDAVWNDSPRPSLDVPRDTFPPVVSPNFIKPQLQLNINYGSFSGSFASRRESLLSPSSGRRTKQNRGITEIALPDLTRSYHHHHQHQTSYDSNVLHCSPVLRGETNAAFISTPPSPPPTPRLLSSTSSLDALKYQLSPGRKTTRSVSEMEFLVPQPPASRQGVRHFSKPRLLISTTTTIGSNSTISGSQSSHSDQTTNPILATITNAIVNNNNNNNANKMTKKQLKLAQAQLDKLTQINIHLHALFSAVEHGHLDKARTILESTDVDINSLNSDGLSPLDVAVLSNNRSMTKMLLQHGATEGSQFKSVDSLGNHLNGLLHDAENRIHDLSTADEIAQAPFSTRASFSSIIGNSGPSVTGCAGTDADKQIGLWERRVKGLRRMLLGWDQARPPDEPSAITVDVAGQNSVAISILEPLDGPIGTKFKVQWSSKADFSNIMGEREIAEWTSYQGVMGATCRINDLTQGRRYFFRACCGNVKGWGPYHMAVPSSVVPSSWRDMDNREPRFAGRQRILDDLFTAVRLARPEDASELLLETPAQQRRNPKKKTTIKQLFSATSKFQKNLRRGIYLACILYYEDKILVTNEDFIPVIEIDETYPSSLHNDYHWFMKVACTWEDVKSLRTDMERNATSAVHFRTKLLSAACQMQSALCTTDIGQLYHKPIRDSHGTVVLSCVNCVKSPKSISVLNSRWVPLNKVQKKVMALHEDNNIHEILITSIAEQIKYHQASAVKLTRGLYMGYLKLQSSVDQIQVVVPSKTPNVLPHCKIRENPHVSVEEWEILKRVRTNTSIEFRPRSEGYTEVQQLFLEALTTAAHRLFNYINVSPDDSLAQRLYDVEVIELSADVSLLIVCPPVESSCAVPGQREILLQRGDLLSLPIQAFEMIHLRTYQNSIIQKYSRLSCILELDTALANHSHREAFSTVELQAAKERLAKLQELTIGLNVVWKGVRWLMDVIAFARDRASSSSITMKEILELNCLRATQPPEDEDRNCNSIRQHQAQQLQLPQRETKLMKSSPGRGSWPGPQASNNLDCSIFLGAEYSKSEQNLGLSSLSPRYLSATSDNECNSRKNSADSNCSHSGTSYFSAGESNEHFLLPRLPPSRSEDTLTIPKKHSIAHHRRRATTANNASIAAATAPLLAVKSNYPMAAGSVQSLSSDSESVSYPLMTSTPTKCKTSDDEFVESNCTAGKYLKPTLTALQSEMTKEPLHITEPIRSSDRSHHRTKVRQSSEDEDIAAGLGSSGMTSSSASSSNNNPPAGIIQVYAAYDTGLASGTSLKLHVTPKTTAREVVDLVVKQLNMAVVLKGKDGPIYTPDKLENFCLVAVIGARERCLRDDFRPLQLQNPWKKGKLYVRQKHDLLAAIEHSNRDAQLI